MTAQAEHMATTTPVIPDWIDPRMRGIHWDVKSELWRDEWDRYVQPARDHTEHTGKCYCGHGAQRVSTGTKTLDDESTLFDFNGRHKAKGFAENPDLLARAKALPLPGEQLPGDDRSDKEIRSLWKALDEEALYRGRGKEAADMGTFMHHLSEEIDLGRLTVDDVAAYVASRTVDEHPSKELCDNHLLTVRQATQYDWTALCQSWVDLRDAYFEVFDELVEVQIKNWTYMWGGQADRIGIDKTDGKWKVIDLKTGSIDFNPGKFCGQGAAYGAGDVEIVRFPADREPFYQPLPEGIDQDEMLMVHIPINNPAGAGVYRVPIARAAAETLPLAAAVTQERAKQKGTKLELVGSVRMARAEKSEHEVSPAVVAAAEKQAGTRRCGYCSEPGHTKRTCPQLNSPLALVTSVPADTRTKWEKAVDECPAAPEEFDRIVAAAGSEWTTALLNRARARLGLPPK